MDPAAQPKESVLGKWIAGIVLTLLVLIMVVLIIAISFLSYYNIPSNGAGMAAKAVCSGRFVAGRDAPANTLFEEDLLGANPAFAAVSATIDEQQRTATGSFLGLVHRTAALLPDRGCVLDAEPDPAAVPYAPTTQGPAAWPAGDGVSPGATARLEQVLDEALVGAGDPTAANKRGSAVVQGGKLLALREAPGFEGGVALHGWSMTKTVSAMLAYRKLAEVGIGIETPVVDAFPSGREPAWVAQWRADERAEITIRDLLDMLSGLDTDEGYNPWDPVVQMLNGEPDMAGWAAHHGLEATPGTFWEYLSADSNILAEVVRGQFASDEEYWAYPSKALFDPIGVDSATLETDTVGTWVASSYLWASVADWARMGELMLKDGVWQGRRVLPQGWLELASTPALPTGEGAGYGSQSWLPGNPVGGECRGNPGVPADTVSMEGHWGQLIAMVPSRDAVIVRLGWTFNRDQFDSCRFVADVLAALPN